MIYLQCRGNLQTLSVRTPGPPPLYSDSPAGFLTTRSEMIENEHPDCRREIVAFAAVGNPLY